MFSPNYLSNKYGILRMSTDTVSVGTSTVSFKVPFLFREPGLVLLKLDLEIPSGTTESLEVVLTDPYGNTLPVTTVGSIPVTVADVTTGVYLAYYEAKTLLIIN